MTYDAREISGDLGAPLECFEFMADQSFLYTSADEPIQLTIDGAQKDFMPIPISFEAEQFSREDRAGAVRIQLPTADPLVQVLASPNLVVPMTVRIFRTHDGETDYAVLFDGFVDQAQMDLARCTVGCLPTIAAAKRKGPRLIFQSRCTWDLYGTGCGILKSAYAEDVVLTAIAGAAISATIFTTHPDGWYEHGGWIQRGNGQVRFIEKHLGNTVHLQSAFPTDLALSEHVSAFPGCDRLESTCHNKFNNLARFMGFSRRPVRNDFEVGLS